MHRKPIVAGVLIILACVTLGAADFWETKPFLTWSDKEVQQVMTDSPWSQKVSLALAARPGGAGGDAAGGRGGGRRGGGGGGGRGAGGGAPQIDLMLSWRSALPMKQALVRSQVGAGGALTADHQTMLDQKDEVYVVTLLGLPMQLAGATENIKDVTFLMREGKAPLAPMEVLDAPQPGNAIVLIFTFPRSAAIDVADKDVEFVTKVGATELKKKFSLKEMVFHGKLEL